MPSALNPVEFTENVVRDFLRYQATTFRFADSRLRDRMRELLSLDRTRNTPLLQGPYISLSKSFEQGASVESLIGEGVLHPLMNDVAAFPMLYRHQEEALRSIQAGNATLVSTGTGSGKTECFLYPTLDRFIRLRDEGAAPGIRAIFVYPMNALAEDQLLRLREMLCGTGITFGMYVGKTPEKTADAIGEVLPTGSSRSHYRAAIEKNRQQQQVGPVYPPEERVSREQMRTPGQQPRILLTNVKQLELLLTRGADVPLFDGAELEFLVFDEAHTFSGANGAETAALVRRLREFIGSPHRSIRFVGTSATLTDPEGGDAPARRFASRFFGVEEEGVRVISETYEQQVWQERRTWPARPGGDPASHLAEVLAALGRGDEEVDGAALAMAWSKFQPAEEPVAAKRWNEHLRARLSGNGLCFHLSKELDGPRPLAALAEEFSNKEQRPHTEEELLTWLALGAAVHQEGRPLLRPKVHGFMRGLDGAIVDFPFGEEMPGPRLWLSAQDQVDAEGDDGPTRLPVTVCTTCGQHYFVHWVNDLELGQAGPGGGDPFGQSAVWEPLPESQGGVRVVLFDRLVGDEDDDDDGVPGAAGATAPRRTHALFLCRKCGALHGRQGEVCRCGAVERRIPLWGVEHETRDDQAQTDRLRGYLTSCRACRATGAPRGAGYREPARPVRATPVADVHVLAQSMLQRSARKRLLVFTDNRQEAAFQAGWMRDHARHFRLRALMADGIGAGGHSVGDLVARLEETFDKDETLSRALLPEVWDVARLERAGREHVKRRREFLRIQVLLELTQAKKQTRGLEPWGRIRIGYLGLEPNLAIVQRWARDLGVEPDRMMDGFAALLDLYRRDRLVHDPATKIFTRFMMDGDRFVQDSFAPKLQSVPKGLKLERASNDEPNRITQLLSARGRTRLIAAAVKLGVADVDRREFIEDFWKLFTEVLQVLTPVTLLGARNGALPGAAGAHQIDADSLVLEPHVGRWRCQSCRKAQVRATPHDRCLQHNCQGTLAWEMEDPDDYDLSQLGQDSLLIRPREHSAQVPGSEREKIETQFKGNSEVVNTLVCTPTLEMGVDIGGLDTVLLRNVPPLPANYWQRVGRAGRQHRLAVAVTYARPTSHDRAYFADPPRMLGGRVEPPRFNLANDEMIAKHVRATVLTGLRGLARNDSLDNEAQFEIAAVLAECFPDHISGFFFDGDNVREKPRDTSALRRVLEAHREALMALVERTFTTTWPSDLREHVTPERLALIVDGMQGQLQDILFRISARLRWHLKQITLINKRAALTGAPSREETAHRWRCERYVARLKGMDTRTRQQAQGQDETYTWSVLAAEGYLPGYGLETGSIRATAEVQTSGGRGGDLVLGRPPAVALREYVPGNMIYANGQRYVARRFLLQPVEPVEVAVDTAASAVEVLGGGNNDGLSTMAALTLPAIPVSDCELIFTSRISDEEEYRFQMPVAVYATELGRHGAGQAYDWAEQSVEFRRGVHLRLVNVGSARQVEAGRGELGYPVCRADGDSRSPLSSPRELANFADSKAHFQATVDRVAFYADVVVDVLSFPDIENQTVAWSLIEVLRMAMSEVLDMERGDIQGHVIGTRGMQQVLAALYDPMPGGSGLLEQASERWSEIVEVARRIVEECPACCETSCIDCLQDFRNSFLHKHLDRHAALELLQTRGPILDEMHPIVERLPSTDEGDPVNDAERRLKQLLESARLTGGKWQERIILGAPLGSTTPDVTFEIDDLDEKPICVYLDGLSRTLHGDPARAHRDMMIREELRRQEYIVIEIPASHLESRSDMMKHVFKIAKELKGRSEARELKEDTSWFDVSSEPETESSAEALDLLDDALRGMVDEVKLATDLAPEPTYELLDGQGGCAAQADIAWPGAKIAVVPATEGPDQEAFRSAGWSVFDLDTDTSVIIEAIERAGQRGEA